MHRELFKIISQDPEYFQTQRNGRNNSIHFAIRNSMIKKEIDFDENWYGDNLSQRYRKHYKWITLFKTFSTIYKIPLFFKSFHWHSKFQGTWLFSMATFWKCCRWIEFFKTLELKLKIKMLKYKNKTQKLKLKIKC